MMSLYIQILTEMQKVLKIPQADYWQPIISNTKTEFTITFLSCIYLSITLHMFVSIYFRQDPCLDLSGILI